MSAAACVGVGPAGGQVVAIVVVPDSTPGRRATLADPVLTAQIRAMVDVPIAAVLVRTELPVDVRHNSKVDRTALSRWATEQLA